MFNEVLVPLDGSARSAIALDPARTIAGHLGSELRVASFHRGERPPELVADVVAQMRSLGTKRTRLIIEPVVSTVAERIAASVEDARNPLICMASHGRGRSAAVVGSVAAEVLGRVRRPILLVGRSYRPTSFRSGAPLVVAISGDESDREVVAPAGAFAGALDCPIEIVTVTRGSDEADRADTVLIDSRPAAALVRHLEAVDASAVAMATYNRQGWNRLVHGSTTAAVLRAAPCPVLAIDSSSAHEWTLAPATDARSRSS